MATHLGQDHRELERRLVYHGVNRHGNGILLPIGGQHGDSPAALPEGPASSPPRRFAATIGFICFFILLLPPAASRAQNGQPEWRELLNASGEAEGLIACVGEAKWERPVSWSCMGGELTTADVGPDGDVQVTTRVIADDFPDTDPSQEDQLEGLSGQADDYDSWCENGGVCGRKINDYIAEVKGNAAYGNADGVIGALDFIVRQEFNGPYPAWRGLLIWDYGPTIIPNGFFNVCRINRSLAPDEVCGNNEMFFSNVSSRTFRSWWPSATGLDQLNRRLRGGTKYHDDNYGSFNAQGYPQTFYLAPIHTGRWDRCGRRPYCRYYQAPWK